VLAQQEQHDLHLGRRQRDALGAAAQQVGLRLQRQVAAGVVWVASLPPASQ
jgi:hypothetical protein